MAVLSSLSDQELLSLLREDNHAAYTEIYNRYSGVLYLHAYNRLRDREESKDLLQELFTTIWNNRKDLDIRSTLSGYLYRAVMNRVFKYFSRKQTEEKYIGSIQESVNSGDCITDHLVRQNQLAGIIEKEIDALPPKMREIFVMSRKERLSHKEIAEQLGLAESTVKKQVNNALKILRGKLGLFTYLLFLLFY